mmetsp:Transcript_121126/g.347979  ORF Transcript_121126/g.347979 Transcript_121126/m.347979 type:complete len:230 (-) Transcript_121126:284-973(-)
MSNAFQRQSSPRQNSRGPDAAARSMISSTNQQTVDNCIIATRRCGSLCSVEISASAPMSAMWRMITKPHQLSKRLVATNRRSARWALQPRKGSLLMSTPVSRITTVRRFELDSDAGANREPRCMKSWLNLCSILEICTSKESRGCTLAGALGRVAVSLNIEWCDSLSESLDKAPAAPVIKGPLGDRTLVCPGPPPLDHLRRDVHAELVCAGMALSATSRRGLAGSGDRE